MTLHLGQTHRGNMSLCNHVSSVTVQTRSLFSTTMSGLFQLPEDDEDGSSIYDSISPLPNISTGFFVSRLTEKPQNPILDALKLERQNAHPSSRIRTFEFKPDPPEAQTVAPHNLAEDWDIWKEALKCPDSQVRGFVTAVATRPYSTFQTQLLSWDHLRDTHYKRTGPSAFLSEQDSYVYASARYQ